MSRRPVWLVIAVAMCGLLALASGGAPGAARPLDSPMTPSPSPSPSPTHCPTATPELLAVEPVTSPTSLTSQVVTVRIGNGEAVTVTAESGVFAAFGSFNAYSSPARVNVGLLDNVTHHLAVAARVRVVNAGGCQYGGYTLNTGVDRLGAPLTIVQTPIRLYLPLILKSAAAP